ncbi:AbiJ-NTD4 domain-containing protein [Xanthomonas pisi]|uniref:AbiJ-NTD4 domain-containing protein n=1 Tax=Xanthomonas pisi TaxID=56457 RepID=UPI00062D7B7F|nr:hypothetical protein [Xanthomonas pisi]KLD72221.1 hypothetical protein Y887_02290 [Xanthomonas pisi DSM 18956]
MTTFSTRHVLSRPDAEITIRQDAPSEVRDALTTIAYRYEFRPSALCEVLCGIRYRAPDEANWSEFPNIDEEVRGLLAECEWFEVYDFVEAIASRHPGASVSFADEVNRYFRVAGVGWQLVDGRLEMRGAEVFEEDTLGDLIRRNPDLFSKPVDKIVDKAWGYTSNFGRHLHDEKPPEFEEAELMVGISGVLCRYLARRTAGRG